MNIWIIIAIGITIVFGTMITEEEKAETKKISENANKSNEEMSRPDEKIKKNRGGFLTGCLTGCLISVATVIIIFVGIGWTLSEALSDEWVSEYRYSPDKTYIAYEVGYAGGAIGEDYMHIYVKKYKPGDENKEDAYKRGRKLYTNEVGNPIAFKWKSDNCLIIEGEEYIIDY